MLCATIKLIGKLASVCLCLAILFCSSTYIYKRHLKESNVWLFPVKETTPLLQIVYNQDTQHLYKLCEGPRPVFWPKQMCWCFVFDNANEDKPLDLSPYGFNFQWIDAHRLLICDKTLPLTILSPNGFTVNGIFCATMASALDNGKLTTNIVYIGPNQPPQSKRPITRLTNEYTIPLT